LRAAIRRDRVIAALVAAIVGVAVGLIVLGLMQRSTAGDVRVVQRNSRCNSGDLAACRIVAQNLRRACARSTIAKLPTASRRATARRRCGILTAALPSPATRRRAAAR